MKADSLTKALSERAKYLQLFWANSFQELKERVNREQNLLDAVGIGNDGDHDEVASFVLRCWTDARLRFEDEFSYYIDMSNRALDWQVKGEKTRR